MRTMAVAQAVAYARRQRFAWQLLPYRFRRLSVGKPMLMAAHQGLHCYLPQQSC